MFINKRFILASSSKSRFNILKKNKLSFKKIKPPCNEELLKKKLKNKKTKPEKIANKLAEEKAKSISKNYKKNLVVGCDTIIVFRGKIIDKVDSFVSAKKKLKNLSNKDHQIISSIVVCKNSIKIWEHTEKTKVSIRKLDEKKINNYLKNSGKEILKSVGCYQVENLGPTIIKNIKGDFFNVMGFPLFAFLNFLEKQK